MVLINLDSLPKANSPNTKHVYSAMAASSLRALFSLVEEPGLVGELGPVVSVINRFQSSYFGKENFSGVLKSQSLQQGPCHLGLQRAWSSQGPL